MTKKQIAKEISTRYGIDQSLSKKIVQHVLDAIVRSLVENGRIELRNFGVFEIRRRAARTARNPRTNQPLRVPPKTVVTFQPGKKLAQIAASLGQPGATTDNEEPDLIRAQPEPPSL